MIIWCSLAWLLTYWKGPKVIFGYDVQAEQSLELQHELNKCHIKLMTKDGQKDCSDKGWFDDGTDDLLLEGLGLGEDYQLVGYGWQSTSGQPEDYSCLELWGALNLSISQLLSIESMVVLHHCKLVPHHSVTLPLTLAEEHIQSIQICCSKSSTVVLCVFFRGGWFYFTDNWCWLVSCI